MRNKADVLVVLPFSSPFSPAAPKDKILLCSSRVSRRKRTHTHLSLLVLHPGVWAAGTGGGLPLSQGFGISVEIDSGEAL